MQDLKSFVLQPSVLAQDIGLRDCAALIGVISSAQAIAKRPAPDENGHVYNDIQGSKDAAAIMEHFGRT